MKLEAIAQWLQTRGVGTIGQSLFVNFIPDNITGILLRQDLGGTRVDAELPGWVSGPFWLIARASNYAAAQTLTDQAAAAFKLIPGQTAGGVKFRYVRPLQYPFSYAPSPAQNVELAVKYRTAHVDTTA